MRITDRELRAIAPLLVAEAHRRPSAELDAVVDRILRLARDRGMRSLAAELGRPGEPPEPDRVD